MNKLIVRLLACVAVTQIGAAGAAVAAANQSSTPDEEAWGRASSVNTLEAYAKFSMDFPDSRHADEARLKLATLSPDAKGDADRDQPSTSLLPEIIPNSLMVV